METMMETKDSADWKVANPGLAKAMMELRRSNAAVPHDARPRRERSRNAAKRAAIRRSMEW